MISSNNVTGSVAVFTAPVINKVKRIVYCSSMARYGNNSAPFKETDEVKPVDPYGVSKVAERYFKDSFQNSWYRI